jgi:hypothetical protein
MQVRSVTSQDQFLSNVAGIYSIFPQYLKDSNQLPPVILCNIDTQAKARYSFAKNSSYDLRRYRLRLIPLNSERSEY